MNAANDLFFLIVILIGLGLVWAATGGPERAAEKYGGVATEPSEVVLGQEKIQKEDAVDNTPQTDSSNGDADEQVILPETASYKGQVIIVKSSSGPRKADADDEYIEIRTERDNTAPVPITGWKVTSLVSGITLEIKKGVRLYKTGFVGTEGMIPLEPGDRAYIATGRSPVGASFRANICTGYLEQFQDFSPRLTKECPRPRDELDAADVETIRAFGNECLDFIERLPRCEMHLDTLPARFPSECREFIDTTINYNGCVEKHRNDPDFYKSEWRIYLGRDDEIWRDKRETIVLLDSEGRTVDTFTY